MYRGRVLKKAVGIGGGLSILRQIYAKSVDNFWSLGRYRVRAENSSQ